MACGRRWPRMTMLRGAIEAHGGWLFKHTGDGVCAAFASPSCAVDAAVAAQRALELPVRMGIATGEAELRGADYFGAVLNRAARVMAAGHGGQILLAESTAPMRCHSGRGLTGETRSRWLNTRVPKQRTSESLVTSSRVCLSGKLSRSTHESRDKHQARCWNRSSANHHHTMGREFGVVG